MSTAHSWVGGIALAALFFGALHITSVPGQSEEERANARVTELGAKLKANRIAEAKAEWSRRQQIAGHTESFNNLLHPVGQAKIVTNYP